MRELEQLRECYDNYIKYVQKLCQTASPTAGLLGFGSSPKDDPGHERFFYDAKSCAESLAAVSPTPEAAQQAVSLILQSEAENEELELAVWMLIAAQGHAIALISFLSTEDASALLQWYQQRYPRHMRLPIQNQVYKALKQRSKERNPM